ncbi:DUF1549 and DUF1553 domain-containing protein [Gimesia panareensis]|uniref:DUF1549 and DUF1553 domain-containing protein n=1 Tax=Gimesia panareensis TaxID=2527978 RepID=UPI00118835A9|nr:DUF1549 and DUF1553 domain-containing protein [Gimesia panareensis]QDU50647.1 Bacterial Ig-like domain (group 2) [Gimesia panareensis]
MYFRNISVCGFLLTLTLFSVSIAQAAEKTAAASTLPSSSEMQELQFEHAQQTLADRYSRLQLQVVGIDERGRKSDQTRKVTFQATPADKVSIDERGRVTPLAGGQVTITARAVSGKTAQTRITVHELTDTAPGFKDRVMPLLSKYSCNTCHGKPRGQNGFELSLFGSDAAKDYNFIVKQSRGRRISQALPAESLLLRKATSSIPHGGGKRFAVGSVAWQTMHDWIQGGAPVGSQSDFKVAKIEVLPSERVMTLEGEQQLSVIAHYTNGMVEDVTHLAIYHTNEDSMVEIDESGLVKAQDRQGEFAIVVVYGGQVGAFRGIIPFGYPVEEQQKSNNPIDKAVLAKLDRLGIPPSPRCSDETFLRRVTIDLAGRLPSLEETNAFKADQSSDKRNRKIDELLDSPEYADYFASKWIHLLRNARSAPEHRRGTFSFHHWIRESFRQNKPYDKFVRDILTASGDVTQHPPATWYREVSKMEDQVENMSQIFLGVRITCARCHHHPFEKWSQQDYYQLAAFFSQVDRKISVDGNPTYFEERIFHKRGVAQVKHPATGENLKPAGLGAEPLTIPADDDPRHKLVDWMVDPQNPYFSTVLVNRYWKHFFGKGIVDPEDDLRETNPPSNPELLESLRQEFIASGYDLKQLARLICQSDTYQRSVETNGYNLEDTQFFSRFYPRRMNAEVVLDAIDQLLGTNTSFTRLPPDMKAVQLPDSAKNFSNEFLQLFGRPKAQSACECERSQDGDLRQSLYLLTSADILQKLSSSKSRPAQLAKEKEKTEAQQITELYLRAFSRPPRADELKLATEHLQKNPYKNKAKAYEDLLWAIFNTKEFLYNH